MLRLSIALLVAIAVSETAESAEKPLVHHSSHHGWRRAAASLPAGLPRRHYDFRTTISYRDPPPYRPRAVSVYETLEPPYVKIPYIPPWFGAALLPGSLTLPGYYGSTYSYDYHDPYYGGPQLPYWDRLPYACGVYGYC